MSPETATWPELLRRVAAEVNAGAALSLAANFGGRELYIPRPASIDEAHPLALALGLATARKVAEVLRDGKILIPMGPVSNQRRRAEAMRRMKREGLTNAAAARALGVHERTVYLRHQVDREAGLTDPTAPNLDLFRD